MAWQLAVSVEPLCWLSRLVRLAAQSKVRAASSAFVSMPQRRSGLEEFYDARSRRASILSSGGSSACEPLAGGREQAGSRLCALLPPWALHPSMHPLHSWQSCKRAVPQLVYPAASTPAPADLSAGEDDSEFYTPKASDMQQQGECGGARPCTTECCGDRCRHAAQQLMCSPAGACVADVEWHPARNAGRSVAPRARPNAAPLAPPVQ